MNKQTPDVLNPLPLAPSAEDVINLITAPALYRPRQHCSLIPPFGAVLQLSFSGPPGLLQATRSVATIAMNNYLAGSDAWCASNVIDADRRAACLHEAGSAVIATATGLAVRSSRVWFDEPSARWTGFTTAPDPGFSSEVGMAGKICRTLAGLLAELRDMRYFVPGSCADEVGTAHGLCFFIAAVRDLAGAWKKDMRPYGLAPYNPQVLHTTVNAVKGHFEKHQVAVVEISDLLYREGALSKASLDGILRHVDPVPLARIVRTLKGKK